MPLIPDQCKYVESLTDEQATFLYVELQIIKGAKLYKLREALADRVLGHADPSALRQGMIHEFYSPDAPIRAVPVRPKKRRQG